MASVSRFLREGLRLKANESRRAVGRPWKRKFLGDSLTHHKAARLKVAVESVRRFKDKVKARFGAGRGRNLGSFIREDLNPLLRGWANDFVLSEVKGVIEELDGWIRRKLRCVPWRQWKRPWTRYQRWQKLGLAEARARESAWNGRGPWWNTGASHLNAALPAGYNQRLGLISLLTEAHWFRKPT